MKKRLILFLAGICLLAVTSMAQQPQNILKASASLNKKTYVVGEPIFLNLSIKNPIYELIEFRTRLSFYGDMRISVLQPGRLPEDYTGTHEPSIPPSYVFKIPPLQTVNISFIIYYKKDTSNNLLFPAPIKAALSVRLAGLAGRQPEEYNFEPMELEVVAPDEKDVPALQFLLDKKLIREIHTGRSLQENRTVFESFIKEFPETTYTPYAIYALSGSLMFGGRNEAADRKRLIELLSGFIKNFAGNPLEDDAVYRIADAYDRLGMPEQAKRWYVKLYNEYINSNRINFSDPLIVKYILGAPDSKDSNVDNWMLYERLKPEFPLKEEELSSQRSASF
ncbi:MAG: hypothetical protein BWY12_02641 [candidate division BRC1 bacterium ADurb.Bin183]|nr:MAG: hypothetical protein BWY12_02641 [candidate division BRC1 bacterium ADurb.Bin183]